MRRLTITTSNSYIYDPERVQSLYEQLQPNPQLYGDEPVYAVWAYLNESMFGSDVFADRGDFDQGYDDAEYDPEA
jgi:hypothetical protein